jgi:hypothetical protein
MAGVVQAVFESKYTWRNARSVMVIQMLAGGMFNFKSCDHDSCVSVTKRATLGGPQNIINKKSQHFKNEQTICFGTTVSDIVTRKGKKGCQRKQRKKLFPNEG